MNKKVSKPVVIPPKKTAHKENKSAQASKPKKQIESGRMGRKKRELTDLYEGKLQIHPLYL